ncbi:hypothetical protein K7G98_05030 [Saccharothrix sp. MB29]|nr:hypothetical protein [Saccharothrix sp. MB29]
MSNLHGRDREWASVLRFLSAPGGLLAIDGPPCSGKTLLLHEAVRAARDRGYSVVLVAGEHLAGSADVARALERVGFDRGARPLIAVDQAHRDPAAVLALLSRLGEHRVTVLLVLSGAFAGAELRRAVAAGEVLLLGPVADDVVEALVRAQLDAVPTAELAALTAAAGGNPRLAAELVAGLREEGQLEVRDGVARLRGGWLPQRVTALVRGQADALSAKATQVLRVAAVIGRSFRLADVATMVGETTGALLLAVDELLASGLVVCVDERLGFASELVWRAVVESMPASVLHALRHDAAVLRTALEDVPRVAEAPCAEEEPEGDADRDRVAVRGVRALAAGGRLGSAIALARDSLAGRVYAGGAAELRVLLAGILLADGRPADAVTELEHALVTTGVPGPLRRLAAAGRLLSLYFAGGSRAGAHALSVLTCRDREPSDADVVMAATVHSCLEWSSGNLAEGVLGPRSTRWEWTGPPRGGSRSRRCRSR